MTTRTFDKDILRDLVHGDGPEGYEFVETQDCGKSRWSSHHLLIFKHDGKLWASEYSQGLSETQDQYPYEYDEPTAFEVEAREKVVVTTEYVAI